MNKLFIVVFLSLAFTTAHAKSVDSLLNLYKNTKGVNKIDILIQLSEVSLQDSFELSYKYGIEAINLSEKQHNNSIKAKSFYNMGLVFAQIENYDSAIYYTNISEVFIEKDNNNELLIEVKLRLGEYFYAINDFTKSIQYYEQCVIIANETGNTKTLLSVYKTLAGIYFTKSEYEKTIELLDKQLTINVELQDSAAIAEIYNSISANKRRLGNYSEAIEYNQKALQLFYELQDTMGIADSYVSLGAIYYYSDDYSQAIKYFIKASEIFEEKGNLNSAAGIYNNIGSVYIETKEFKKALSFFKKAFKFYEEIGFLYAKAIVTGNIGLSYEGIGDYDKAFEYFNKSLEYQELLDNKEGIANAISNIAGLYLTENKLHKAKKEYQKALEIAIEGKYLHAQLSIYNKLIEVEEKLGNYKKTIQVIRAHQIIKDSLQNKESREQLNEVQAKLKLHEHEAKIEILSKKNEIQKTKVEKQRLIITGIIIISALFLIMIIIILYALRFSREAKSLLQKKNLEIIKNRNEIAVKNKEFTDSITYASRTQNAMFSPIGEITKAFKEFFILTKPQNIVSGDFYWFKKIDRKLYIALADCTGHGVPGAFMSILGNAFLNEIVDKNPNLTANQILDELRSKIKFSLQQKDHKGNFDGLDIAFCIFSEDKSELEFAGAHNPLYIVRKNKIIELKADNMPVSIARNEKPFSLQKFEIQQGDKFYFTTDGFYDQFGGNNNTKISRKTFKQLLIKHQVMPMTDQAIAFENYFNKWKAQTVQTDDMSIIGFELLKSESH